MRSFLSTIIMALLGTSSLHAQIDLRSGFLNPPQEARPRVWWHWMNGNITKEGIRKDIEWMHRAGIGGFHCFEAGMDIKPVVEKRLTYMSPEWKDAFRYAIALADSFGMETAIASCPGWSNTGGPWVKPEQAMKRLVWSETVVKGGRQDITLPEPETYQWYRDICVLAVRMNKADKPLRKTVKAISINDGQYRSIWAAQKAPVNKHLEASNDGKSFTRVCDIPHGSVSWQTIQIPTTKARYFRVVFDEEPSRQPDVKFYAVPRVNHVEEKAGFASPVDLNDHPTAATRAEAVPLTDVINLTDKVDAGGRLNWKAPKGNWRILRFGYTLTGKTNHPAPPEATGLEVTKLDKEAFSHFLNYYLDLYQEFSSPRYLLIDSYEAGWETWSPHLAQEFEQRRGYSLWKWLPVLTGQVLESGEQSEEFLFDWRTTIGELILECMYENAARIAHERGMETYFEAHENGRLYLADGMAVKSKADIPMAAMWAVVPGTKTDNSSTAMAQSDIRESASVAHLYGKKLVACESMTVNGQAGGAYMFYPGNLKPTADLEMASGANRFVIHESAHQPVDDKRPGLGLGIYGQWFNRHETWAEQARAWTDYLARSSYMLQQGRNVADILYYYGEDDVVTNLFAHEPPAPPKIGGWGSYNFDYLNKEALLDLISFDGEHLVTPSGSRYRLLVVSNRCIHFAPEVIRKLQQLKQLGAVVIDEKRSSVAEALKNIPPDFKADDMSDLRFVHRTTPDAHIYWVSNSRQQARHVSATFRISSLRPTLWHPDTGIIEDVSYEMKDSTTTVHFHMTENDAVFIVFSGKADLQEVSIPRPRQTLLTRIDTPWNVQFFPLSVNITFPRLMSYTDSPDPDIKYYSGTAIYNNKVELTESQRQQGRLVLDLGQVGCMAEVVVNGQNMGTLWKTPYRIDITDALQSGQNDLQIRVVNQWVNRIIGDMQPDCTVKHTYTPTTFYKPDSPLLPAGLLGPVELLTIAP